jgi:hypothetical protein
VVVDYTTPAGVTSTTLSSGLSPNTAYQCQIRAINLPGAKSAYNPAPTYSAANPAFVCMTGTSFTNNVNPIFTGICNGCHTGGSTTPGPYSASFFNLPTGGVHAPAGGYCSTSNQFLVSGVPAQSLIYLRMINHDGYFSGCTDFGTVNYQMPQGGPYPQANINTMYNWITQGLDSTH